MKSYQGCCFRCCFRIIVLNQNIRNNCLQNIDVFCAIRTCSKLLVCLAYDLIHSLKFEHSNPHHVVVLLLLHANLFLLCLKLTDCIYIVICSCFIRSFCKLSSGHYFFHATVPNINLHINAFACSRSFSTFEVIITTRMLLHSTLLI